MEGSYSSNFTMMNDNPAKLKSIELQLSGNPGSPTNGSNSSPKLSNEKGLGKQHVTDVNSQLSKVAPLGLPPLPPSSSTSHPRKHECQISSASILRVMRSVLPPDAKISDDAKDTMQSCLSHFISFVTKEASDQCQEEKRKTVTTEDLLTSMWRLGFVNYVPLLSTYIKRYREQNGANQRRISSLQQLSFTRPTITGPAMMPNIDNHYDPAVEYAGASHGSINNIASSTTRPYPNMVRPSMTVITQHMVGPKNPNPSNIIGLGDKQGATSTIFVTNVEEPSTGLVTECMPVPNGTSEVEFRAVCSHASNNNANTISCEHGLTPMNNVFYDYEGSSINDWSIEFGGDTDQPHYSTCSGCRGCVNQDDDIFNHSDKLK